MACTEKGLWPMAWLCFFTLSTHSSGCSRPGKLLCLALLIFRGKGVGGGSRRLMRQCQMGHSRGAVGTLCFEQCFRAFDPHPCCPSSPPCARGPGGVQGLGTGRKKVELRDAVLKDCLSSPFTLQQGWERQSAIERGREEGDFQYFSKNKSMH